MSLPIEAYVHDPPCTCTDGFTCGECLRNAKPWHFTTSKSFSEWLHDQQVLEERAALRERLYREKRA